MPQKGWQVLGIMAKLSKNEEMKEENLGKGLPT